MRRKAVIADMDGTLADVRSIRHFVASKPKNFDAFHAASEFVPANAQALEFVERFHASGHVVLVVTARMQRWEPATRRWLARHMPVPFEGPFHRQDGDVRPDVQVKREIHRYLARQFDIRAAVDDNPAVVALWDELGIPVEVIPGWEV